MLWFKKETKKAEGVDLINQVANQFSNMIADLEDGSDDCQCDCVAIREQMSALTTRHGFLEKASDRAVKIAARLKELIGE